MPDHAQQPTDAAVWINQAMDTACAEHVPPIATDGWWALRWRVMSAEEVAGFTRARGEAPGCRACEALSKAVPHATGS